MIVIIINNKINNNINNINNNTNIKSNINNSNNINNNNKSKCLKYFNYEIKIVLIHTFLFIGFFIIISFQLTMFYGSFQPYFYYFRLYFFNVIYVLWLFSTIFLLF